MSNLSGSGRRKLEKILSIGCTHRNISENVPTFFNHVRSVNQPQLKRSRRGTLTNP